jgi:hypothetical protein
LGYTRRVLTSVKYLRNCFRRGIIGDRRSDTFNLFWNAVGAFAPDVEITVDRPTSSRNTTELQPAFNLVVELLRGACTGSVWGWGGGTMPLFFTLQACSCNTRRPHAPSTTVGSTASAAVCQGVGEGGGV